MYQSQHVFLEVIRIAHLPLDKVAYPAEILLHKRKIQAHRVINLIMIFLGYIRAEHSVNRIARNNMDQRERKDRDYDQYYDGLKKAF